MTNLVGFCDASSKAYAAVVYLRFKDESSGFVGAQLITAKTRVTPVGGMTIPTTVSVVGVQADCECSRST